MVLGDEVLQAKQLPKGTLIEMLELSLNGMKAVMDVQQLHGRFLAVRKEFLDPATLADQRRVTLVGQ